MEKNLFRKEVRVIEHNFYFYTASSILAVALLVSYILVMFVGFSGYTFSWFPIPLIFLGGYLIYGIPVSIREYKLNKGVFTSWHNPEELINLLKTNNWKAAVALAHFTSEDLVVKILTGEMMDNTNWLVRKWSAWALGYTSEKKSILELIEVFQYDSAPEVRENAIQAIMKMGAVEDAFDQLKLVSTTDPTHYVRRIARKAIANLKDVEL
ncbi:MAG: HEAT repeat domain-containing protein [Candidatus Heimdallarchaeota archaeon]